LLKHQNKIKEDQLNYLKEMERKLKAIITEWRKADDKEEAIKLIQALLFKQKEKIHHQKKAAKQDKRFVELDEPVQEGDKVKMKQNRQIGIVKQIRGKKAIVQVGLMPMTVDYADLVKVFEKKEEPIGE
jgi:DNA mismatch repair protein MutS2